MGETVLEFITENAQCPPARGLYLYQKFAQEPEFVAYRDLPGRVAAYAEHLRGQGIAPGTRVLFPFETSAPVILSFLALLEIGALPLSVKPLLLNMTKDAYEDFIGRVARDHRAEYVLGVPSLANVAAPVPAATLPPADLAPSAAGLRTPPGEELAFVQFSSGSTSFPKGIPVSHDMLRKNLAMILNTDGRLPHERVSSWLPLYHDMGLVGGLLSCLARGCDLLLATPEVFLFDASGWWEHMARERVMGSVIPNFAIDYSLRMMESAAPQDIADLDLSGLRSIYLGSEPINVPNLEALLDLLAPAGLRRDVFMPCYGMAEAVLLVSSMPPGSGIRLVKAPSGVPAISVGRPMPQFTVRLRDEAGRICQENELGEIELAGGSLAASYFESEIELLAPDGFYPTGDIGFVDDAELFITGRISDRIKVNGQSFFAADFEQALERLAFVRDGRSAILQLDGTGGAIVVLAEVDRTARADIEGSRATIVAHLVQSMGVKVDASDVHYVRPGQLSRTSSGKLQRRAIARAYRDGTLEGLTLTGRPRDQ
ncbi:MAG TPA: AMP-binding protein [Actinocrinis sp.]|nr:AMP-binding protein [Actinocrinis sp.]